MNKGDYGYMNYYKKKHIIATLIYAAIITVLFLLAHIVTVKIVILVCYVCAVVLVLPGAKHAVAVIVVLPYHTMDEQSIEDLDEHTRELEYGIAVYDVTLASEEGIMYAPYLYLTKGRIYCLVLNITAKTSLDSVKQYLSKILIDAGLVMDIVMVHNISEMNKLLEEMEDDSETNMELLNKTKEQILIYNV
ncbi:MAG: hypothetical protein PUC39_09185 [Lachnospiraceae bacterium]|nr:hypothetical protein [Lachnospiraceae bacterium]